MVARSVTWSNIRAKVGFSTSNYQRHVIESSASFLEGRHSAYNFRECVSSTH